MVMESYLSISLCLYVVHLSISESFLTVKGAALFLPRGNGSSSSCSPRIPAQRSKHAGMTIGKTPHAD